VTLGLGALCLVPLDFIPPLLWLAGVIQGHRARREIKTSGQAGGGAAIAGLVAGYLGLATVVLVILTVVVLVATGIGLAWLNKFIPYLPQGRL